MRTFILAPIDGSKKLDNHHVNEYQLNGEEIFDLISYTTRVASFNKTKREMKVFGWYSNTTLKHIRAFLSFFGFEVLTKKELIKKYSLKKVPDAQNQGFRRTLRT